jgi:hypothetical protein
MLFIFLCMDNTNFLMYGQIYFTCMDKFYFLVYGQNLLPCMDCMNNFFERGTARELAEGREIEMAGA